MFDAAPPTYRDFLAAKVPVDPPSGLLGRKFVGAELKPSYYRQAVENLRNAERARLTGTLFDRAFDAEADAAGSFTAAIDALRERHQAGAPLPKGGYFGGEE